MKLTALNSLLALALAGLLIGCTSDEKQEDIDPIKVNIIRLDKQLMGIERMDSLQSFLDHNPVYARSFYRAYPEDTAFVNHLFFIFTNKDTQKFYQEMSDFYGDMSDLELEFGRAFAQIKKQFPDFEPPKIVATFTGLENDLYVSDSVIYIAMEAFMGKKASYRPQQPAYILQRYQKPYIVPTVLRFISDKYNRNDATDNTLLNDMLYFGKAFEFTASMLPAGSDSLVIAYPDSSMQQVQNAQGIIWAHFIDKQLLFEQNQKIQEKYIGERPKVLEIGPACPGRIGQWLGWRIVQAYREENPDVSLADLMNMTNAQEILEGSKYRGEVDQ